MNNTADSLKYFNNYPNCSKPDYTVALKFINDYAEFSNKSKTQLNLIQWVKKRTDVTEDFKVTLKSILLTAQKEDPENGLGFDPIFDAQDFPEQFEIDTIEENYLIVKGINWPDFKLTMNLKYEKKKWLVDGSGIINIPVDKRIKR